MEAHGVKVNLFALYLFTFITTFNTAHANNNALTNLETSFCTDGSHKALYNFFTEKNYIVIAQGKRTQPSGKIKDFADVLFLVSQDMEYFHAVTLKGIKYDHFKACIFSSAREIDYQFAPPTPDLLPRKNREHMIFLIDDIPNNANCASGDNNCTPWSEWTDKLTQTTLLSAYSYSNKQQHDPYNEIVELTLDNKVIRPTRGTLSQHARIKYALRLRNQLNESVEEAKTAKSAYKQIHDEVDHKLPLVFLNLTDTRNWSIDEINREKGLVQTLLQGVEFELYPMPNSVYKQFLEKQLK